MAKDRSKHDKERQLRAARRRLQPIRGARGRSLKHTRLTAPRVVGLNQFARGLTAPTRRWQPRSRVKAWLLSALPVVVVIVWVVARVARHL
ncbi:MAG TPA: hypothetical protein VII76_03260 [Acidimicrobiales bacterium]